MWHHLAALLAANVALALGPMLVRFSDSGPVAAGFWRLFLSVPVLFALAALNHQKIGGFSIRLRTAVAAAGIFFALDLASWHIGIGLTRLGNVTLLGNSGSLILMAWGIIALRRLPFRNELLALTAALAGAAILLGRSLEIGRETLAGDLLCLLAGFFYAFYLILAQTARVKLGSWSLLAWSSLIGSPVLLGIAIALGEPVWPDRWWPVVTLAFSSQILGQGLLVYSLRHFPPLVIGVSLLTQPGIAVLVGWFVYGEALTALDGLGMALVAGALVLARASERR
jgi:drug/metabolite transporter (DMT)-like permease